MGVGDESTVWVAGGGVIVCVGVWVAVDVGGIGVREGVPVSATFIDVGMDMEGGNIDRQAVRTRTKMKSECLNNIIP